MQGRKKPQTDIQIEVYAHTHNFKYKFSKNFMGGKTLKEKNKQYKTKSNENVLRNCEIPANDALWMVFLGPGRFSSLRASDDGGMISFRIKQAHNTRFVR